LAILVLVPLAMLIVGAVASFFRMRQALERTLSTAQPTDSTAPTPTQGGLSGGDGHRGMDAQPQKQTAQQWSFWMATIQLDKIGPKVSAGCRVQSTVSAGYCACRVQGSVNAGYRVQDVA
jgi:hypothetical protein